jgi:hypothetical protein
MKLLWLVAIACACAAATPAAADQTGIAYDQISILYFGGTATAPPPGPFAALRDGLQPASSTSTGFPPAGGQTVPSLDGIGQLAHGLLYHESFLGTRSRVDDPATMRATISRPDENEVIYLDLTAKTYRTVSGDAARALLHPTPANVLFARPTPAPSASADQDSETIVSTRTAASVDGVTIDGVATHGVKMISTSTATAVTGICPAIATTTTILKYVDPSRDEPVAHYDFSDAEKMLKSIPAMTCRFILAPSATPAPLPDEHKFALYTRADTQTTVPGLATSFTTTMLITRGNLKTLGPADAGLFEVPSGFTAAP